MSVLKPPPKPRAKPKVNEISILLIDDSHEDALEYLKDILEHRTGIFFEAPTDTVSLDQINLSDFDLVIFDVNFEGYFNFDTMNNEYIINGDYVNDGAQLALFCIENEILPPHRIAIWSSHSEDYGDSIDKLPSEVIKIDLYDDDKKIKDTLDLFISNFLEEKEKQNHQKYVITEETSNKIAVTTIYIPDQAHDTKEKDGGKMVNIQVRSNHKLDELSENSIKYFTRKLFSESDPTHTIWSIGNDKWKVKIDEELDPEFKEKEDNFFYYVFSKRVHEDNDIVSSLTFNNHNIPAFQIQVAFENWKDTLHNNKEDIPKIWRPLYNLFLSHSLIDKYLQEGDNKDCIKYLLELSWFGRFESQVYLYQKLALNGLTIEKIMTKMAPFHDEDFPIIHGVYYGQIEEINEKEDEAKVKLTNILNTEVYGTKIFVFSKLQKENIVREKSQIRYVAFEVYIEKNESTERIWSFKIDPFDHYFNFF